MANSNTSSWRLDRRINDDLVARQEVRLHASPLDHEGKRAAAHTHIRLQNFVARSQSIGVCDFRPIAGLDAVDDWNTSAVTEVDGAGAVRVHGPRFCEQPLEADVEQPREPDQSLTVRTSATGLPL